MLLQVTGEEFDNNFREVNVSRVIPDFMDVYIRPQDSFHYWLNIVLECEIESYG